MATILDLVREAYTNWDDAGTLARVGRELHDRNRLDVARDVLHRAIERGANDDVTWAHLAYAYMRGSMPDDGFRILREGIERTGSDILRGALAGFTPDAEESAALQAKLAESDEPAVRAGLCSARAWKGDQDAFADLQKLFDAHRDDPKVRDAWLWVLFASGGRPGGEPVDLVSVAVPVADETIADEPDRVGTHWMKAQLLACAEAWDALLDATADALARFPDEETLMFLRGRAFAGLGDADRAVPCFDRAIGMKPTFAGARAELGAVHEEKGRLELAEEVLREAIVANPGYAGAPIALALFLGRRERWDEAETLFLENWSKLAPWQQGRVRQHPANAHLLERDRVRAALA